MPMGYISLHRKIQDCWIWEDKPFDRRSAWIDLLLLAAYKDTKQMVDGDLVEVHRGQYVTSIRRLADRWGWSKDKVSKFLMLLERDGMLQRTASKKRTLLTLVNYGFYQDDQDKEKTVTGQSADSDRTVSGHKNNNENNDNNIYIIDSKESICPSPSAKDAEQKILHENCKRAVELWNGLSELGLKPVTKMSSTTKRYEMLKARLREYGMECYEKAIDNIRHSDFLLGRTKKVFTLTFDWFVRPNNFPKVLEGNYNHATANEMPGGRMSSGGEWQ